MIVRTLMAALFATISVSVLNAHDVINSATAAKSDDGHLFMRKKLDAVGKIVEGLTVEDFSLIESGSSDLLKLSEQSAWKVRRDPLYMHYSHAFQNNVSELQNAAKRENLGDATFSYINLTVSCMACHKHTRNVIQTAPAQIGGQGSRVIR